MDAVFPTSRAAVAGPDHGFTAKGHGASLRGETRELPSVAWSTSLKRGLALGFDQAEGKGMEFFLTRHVANLGQMATLNAVSQRQGSSAIRSSLYDL